MNLLHNETSPYLLQHKDNPVHWRGWNAAALAEAARENKPILLSIGYSACHWCHVMAHESFEDAETAALMNQHFINIKVDREERPDIDALYQGALSLMGKQGGWPLTMFLTPEAKPFWGGTYFPPQPRYGMPSFREVLRGVAESYIKEPQNIEHNVKSLAAALERINTPLSGHLLNRFELDKLGHYFVSLIDPAHGGFGQAPKFPNLPAMNFIWGCYTRTGDLSCRAAVIHSLTQMCQGGIYDHIGGGFARYAVDAEWLVPHFEKMLCDNAQFIALLTEVWKETKNPLFAARIEETIAFAQRELSVRNHSHTAFAAALDADSDGEEGKYYVWAAEEIDALLGDDAESFRETYDVTRFGNWEGKNILNRLRVPEWGSDVFEQTQAGCREKLHLARLQRVPPARDDKVLTDGNGLMIAALAAAGFAFAREDWLAAAESAFRFIATNMVAPEDRLHHSWCAGRAKHPAVLEDYANMMNAALALHEVTHDTAYLTQALAWAATVERDFGGDAGYFTSTGSDMPLRPRAAQDHAVPAGNATLVGVLMRLSLLTGDENFASRANRLAGAFFGEVAQQFFPYATLLNNAVLLLTPLTLVIIGEDAAFVGALRNVSQPGLARLTLLPDMVVPKNHPGFGKALVDGGPAAYICRGRQCLPPVTGAAQLRDLLQRAARTDGVLTANDD